MSEDPKAEIAEFDVLIAIDKAGWLIPQLEKILPPEAKDAIEKGTGYRRFASPDPLSPGPFSIYKPVFHFDENADRLLVASRVEFLDRCLSADEPRLADQKEYLSLTKDLPVNGNGFYYLSAACTGAGGMFRFNRRHCLPSSMDM